MTTDIEPAEIAEYAREQYGERAGKLAFGVAAGEKSNGTVGRVTASGNRERLKAEYGVSFDSLLEEAREYDPDVTPERAIDHLDEYGGGSSLAAKSREHWGERAEETETDTESGSDEFIDRLDSYVENRGVEYDDLVIMTESDSEYLERLEDSDNLCIARRDDVSAVEAERERLVGMVGIDSSDAASLSLDSLRQIAENDRGVTGTENLSPAPRSGDAQSKDVTRYSEPETAEAIKDRLEYLENHSSGGPLVENAIELYRQKLSALES